MQKRNVLNSPRLSELKKRRQRAVVKKFLLLMAGFLSVFFLGAYLSHVDKLNINNVSVVGNKVVDTEAIENAVKEKISGKYLWLFPKTNILYYPEGSIKKEMQEKFKRLKEINFSVESTRTLTVSVSERAPKYTWCGAMPAVGAANHCYFMDEDGYIFDQSPYFSGEVYFKFYGLFNADNALGSYFLKPIFKKLISFKDILINMGLKPVETYITKDGDIEIYLSGGSLLAKPKIILKTDADFQNVAENLEAALNTEPLQTKFKTKYSSLEYIDLRFGNKVYDKFR